MAKNTHTQNPVTKETVLLEMGKVIPYQFNNRKHPKKQLDLLKNSILECGYLANIIVDENNVILVGHGRYAALQELGYKEIEVVRVSGLDDIQKKKYRITDNTSAMLSETDVENLQIELLAIADVGFTKLTCDIVQIEMPDPDGLWEDFDLPDGEKGKFVQMTFIIAREQKKQVDEAMKAIKASEMFQTAMNYGNDNKNGNALASLCEQWLLQNS